jgi:DNA (cytosine-5)-methyltransferase 1
MRVAGLFAGIGGLELGLSAAGHETHLLCEIWEPARAVLRARFGHVPCKRDISQLRSLPASLDMLVAGFPCQDLSQAGLTAGIDGRQSGLVGHVFRLLDRRRVPWVVLENVPFMLHLRRGKALCRLVEAFEERGYRWAYRVVNTLAFLPQRRERVLFLATLTDIDPAAVLFVDEYEPTETNTSLGTHAHGFYWTEGVRGLGWARDAVPTIKKGSTLGIASPPAVLLPNGRIITPDIRDAERLQGFAVDWTKPAEEVGRASLRWALVGNAVSVPIAAWIGRRLAQPGIFDADRDRALPSNGAWPKAARSDGVQRRAVEITAFPLWKKRLRLSDFLRYSGKLLSARAARGFLSRTERSTLRFVPGFRERVYAHLKRMEKLEETRSRQRSFPAIAVE